MKRISLTAIVLAAAVLLTGPVFSEDERMIMDRDEFFPEFQSDTDMLTGRPDWSFSTKGIQYGGWITPVFLSQSDESSLSSMMLAARLWAKSYLWKNSFIYVRLKDTYTSLSQGSRSDTKNVFDLDLGYISMAFLNQSLRVSAGRKYFLMGTGLVLNGRGDGAEFSYYNPYVNVTLLGSYTGLLVKDDNPYGLSSKDYADGAKRLFVGGTLSSMLMSQEVYFLGLNQIDMGNQSSASKHYQSQYLGLGVKGNMTGSISYYAEAVYEMGQNYLTDSSDALALTGEKKSIDAIAAQLGLDYYLGGLLKPVLTFQYAYGSGDKDRTNHFQSIGNTEGLDNGFLYFGTFVGGYALRPVLSNLHVVRVGGSILPLAAVNSLYVNRISLIFKYSYYMKDIKNSPMSDPGSSEAKSFVGHGIDLSLRWKIMYEISAFVNYSVFLPGDAYSSSASDRQFMMLGLNLSF